MADETVSRERTRVPCKVGWYYGRICGQPVQPFRIVSVRTAGTAANQLRVLHGSDHMLLANFDWFGPIPECHPKAEDQASAACGSSKPLPQVKT
jgi:hypothetical protein